MSADSLSSRTLSIAEQATMTVRPETSRGVPSGARKCTRAMRAPSDERCVTVQFGSSVKFGRSLIGLSSETQVEDLNPIGSP
jgi:hypothetical protein